MADGEAVDEVREALKDARQALFEAAQEVRSGLAETIGWLEWADWLEREGNAADAALRKSLGLRPKKRQGAL